jgi:FxLD family lantipeptide
MFGKLRESSWTPLPARVTLTLRAENETPLKELSMSASTMKPEPQRDAAAEAVLFDLDVSLLEVADPAGLVNVTNDNCGSTCGACVTGAA